MGSSLTYEAAPLYPKSRLARLIARELVPATTTEMQAPEAALRPRARQKDLWAAIRRDVERRLPKRTIMEIYGVSEFEIDRARKAGS